MLIFNNPASLTKCIPTLAVFAGAKFVAQKNLFFEFQYALTLPADYEAKNGSDVSKYEDLSASGFNLAVNYLF